MGPFRTLYADANSYFSSVTQQLEPNLRGCPVAITAVDGNHGAIVAASYEAKAYGIKTGTLVREARQLCPGIIFRPSRHKLYVRYNLRIAAIFDRLAEVERIRSIDEFQIALSGEETTLEGARKLTAKLKAAVATELGSCLRFSMGIGPNQLLAKIAGKLEKPDGFKWLCNDNMPEAIEHLALDDLPGISTAMLSRLNRAGVTSVTELYRLDPRHARAIWRSVEGERFVRALQGEAIPLVKTRRGGFGNSKVLAPEFRDPASAYLVARWLIEKAASRLRREGRVASSFSLHLSIINHRHVGRSVRCGATQDTMEFLRINRALWRTAWPELRGRRLIGVSVHLGEVDYLSARSGDLFQPTRPAEKTRGEQVSAATDFINRRFGPGTISFGINKPHPGFFERG